MNLTNSKNLYRDAIKTIPGGVNSPVRSFNSVGLTPLFVKKADKAYIFDADDNRYIDYICSWGPMILGHNNKEIYDEVVEAAKNGLSFGYATEKELKMASLICEMVPAMEMVRMVNSGTEAVMSAIRVARGYTGRDKVVKFNGCYHGHSDGLLVEAGSGLMTSGVPGSKGVPVGCTKDTLTARYNDMEGLEKLFESIGNEIAAVIIEPVAANMGVVLPENNFLLELRNLCDKYNTLLIFDEVITGFRLAPGGASEYFGVKPDLITFGKIIGGGMPVGAYGGRKEIMECVSPMGGVYQAGTLSGNPIAMSAGLKVLSILKDNPDTYEKINRSGKILFEGMKNFLNKKGLPYKVNYVGSLGNIFFTDQEVKDYESAKSCNTEIFRDYFKHMINEGICVAPSQFEAMFISTEHNDEIIEKTLRAFENFFNER